MTSNLVATAAITIDASAQYVWTALVTPAAIKQYFFGTTVKSDWKEGGPITWSGEWQGRAYEDKGKVLRFQPGRTLQFTHFSPLSGMPDVPENYHTVTIELAADGSRTRVSISQDNNPDAKARDHSAENWTLVLAGLKHYVEGP